MALIIFNLVGVFVQHSNDAFQDITLKNLKYNNLKSFLNLNCLNIEFIRLS